MSHVKLNIHVLQFFHDPWFQLCGLFIGYVHLEVQWLPLRIDEPVEEVKIC